LVRVVESTVVDAPIADVWRILRDFNGHERWHPAIAASTIEGGEPSDLVGAVRRFRLADGGELREQLLALSDRDHSFTYCLLDSPLPLMGYVASVRLRPVTDGDRTFWEWRSEFQPPRHRRDELTRLVAEGIYRAGFAAIRALVSAPVRALQAPATPVIRTETASARDRVRAIVVERHGGPEVLAPQEIALPPPGPGEVRVRHRAIGVNYIDVYCRTGFFDLLTPPGIPGMEASGMIEAAGPGVTGFRPGERVAYACPPIGAYSEARNMPPELLVRLPDDISDETAAAGLLKGLAASFLLHDVHPVRSGMTVLVHAGAGGVGQLLVQWAKALGADVLATVSTEAKARLVERLGARPILYRRDDFAEVARSLTGGRGVDVAYDAVGRDTFAGSLAALAVRGHLVSFGQASGPVGEWDIGRFASRSLTVSRPNYGHYTGTPALLAPQVERLFRALRAGTVAIAPPTPYPLARAADAHRDLEARRTTGALILTV
jgi:NADPH:quinone reductase